MLWYVAAGSAVGGVCRYLLQLFVLQRVGPAFPLGTLIVNVTGSLILGFVWRLTLDSALSPEVRVLLTTGLLGGYTTFSTFSHDAIALAENGFYWRAAAYVALSVVLALGGTLLGLAAGREFLAMRLRG